MLICLFDIDGTLLSSGGAGQAGMEFALESQFGITQPTEGISVAGRTDFAITSDLLEYHGIEASAENRLLLRDAYLAQLPAELSKRAGLVLPGVVELLERLSERNDVKLGLLTGNFAAGAACKLEHYQLDQYFQFGGYGDDERHRDDVARVAFAEAQRVLRREIDPNDVWVIGDTPADVQCGRAIQANVVAVATGLFSYADLEATQPDHLFADFESVNNVLACFG
jgi:phosphoglycolate phosphatase